MISSNSQTQLYSQFGQTVPKTPLNRQNRDQDQSTISQYQSPTLRQAMSPKVAREYLNSLRSFICQQQQATPKTERMKTIPTQEILYQQPYLYFPVANRFNQDIKLMTPHKIEVRKLNEDGTVHSLRYFYLKQAVLDSSNNIPQSQQIMIVGQKQSGKKKLFQELIKRSMSKLFKLSLQTESGEKTINLSLNDDIKQTIKSILAGVKHYQLVAQGEQNMIACRGLEGFKRDKKDKGILIMCVKPGKEQKSECIKTFKFLEEICKN
ncbi:unnamed protein product (macronuclear) [Paramecium tetraurelia]|uniref:Myosin motor domain-containing protein n=1 Tax=Paramecium tetraurelia TaxID=5888 RepID=A0BJQ2_PARTE|nr:uncharacterized protein GSPATT00029398001 [Paramecium tetraurelia]CAK58769.1 unnamed protein product [Paramecium tetraurelia]|eukprot:XP_001426167.1 hypothetical protein (macronuclear) [Paramecium tetraurelia strain d4-2]